MTNFESTKSGNCIAYDIIAEAVRNFWKQSIPQPVVVYFFQKYDYNFYWEEHAELADCVSSDDYETVEFLDDFCEGQQCVRDIKIVPLERIIDYYRQNKL